MTVSQQKSRPLPGQSISSGQQKLDIENNFALILTATICVDNIPRAYPTDKTIREEQYFTTLSYYLHNHPRLCKIIFIENSNSSLDYLKEVTKNNPYQKQVEFISLDTNLRYGKYGKGFGECMLIQEGLKQSELIKSVSHFGKATGRICLTNITQILETLPADFDCICDYKDQGYKVKRILLNKKDSPFCDTRFIAFSQTFYQQHLEHLHSNFLERFTNRYFCVEVEMYQKIHPLEDKANIIKRLKIEPRFSGISGHSGSKKYSGKDYGSFVEQVKYYVRVLARKLVPWLHI